MNKTRGMVVVVAALLLATACSGEDPGPEPEPTTSPTPTAMKQPEGAHGVTYDVLNWDEYADDEDAIEVVLAWKQINEALAGSINSGDFLAEMREGYAKKPWRTYVDALQIAWNREYTVPTKGEVRVDSVEVTEDGASLVACLWAPSTDYIMGDGEEPDQIWRKYDVALAQPEGSWQIQSFKANGECSGSAP